MTRSRLIPIRRKVFCTELGESFGAYLAGEERIENNRLGCRCFLPWANRIPIASNKVAQRHALQGPRVCWQLMPVSLSLNVPCPFESILPKRE